VASAPSISCIMPTFNRRRFAGQALRYFLAQDYAEKELIIVDDGTEPIADLIPEDVRIRYFRREQRQSLGGKRNFACGQASGDFIVHWDDDDWSAPWRLRYQVEELVAAEADVCGLERVIFYAPGEKRAWEYVYPNGQRRWVYGASLCYRKSYWQAHRFPETQVGEDTRFVWGCNPAKIHTLPDTRFLVTLVHAGNTSPKRTADSRYHAKPLGEVEQLLGEDAGFYRAPELGTAGQLTVAGEPFRQPAALVTAALGVGDILRVTPLVRVLHQMGYGVDVLVATDYADSAELLAGAPEIRRLIQVPSSRGGGSIAAPELTNQEYDVATFTTWTANLRGSIRCKRALAFERRPWLTHGDTHCVERIAEALGWQGDLPPPFALASNRRFGLAPGTIALHAGCKYEWPWKKWHGFAELARRFPHVVVIGTAEDERTDNTYFQNSFAWPAHAQNFIGQLRLQDTAALLRECAALISNDSGLMHLAVALNVPAFGIFGITNPERELMRSPKITVISKNLPCEPSCRQAPWGRRDCHRHLECLKTLTPDEVFMKVSQILPEVAARSRVASPPQEVKETINLIYYGWVFQASGYGQAARSYLHALHRAGINLSVVDLGGTGRAVNDALVESLVGRKVAADFHLFHGVPPHWARQAFPLANVIAMTVWETDTMPSQWRPALNHALEVWMPCEFNLAVFSRSLQRPVFKLPHPIFSSPSAGPGSHTLPVDLEIGAEDFLFYSIFEWQDRKGPGEVIEAFLRAFPAETGVVLLIKSNATAAQTGADTLAEMRKRVPSAARVLIRCEAWAEGEVAALHARGNAYVSLHRGEGWNLPLFDAACRGKPIIATGFSGPLDYLDPHAHCLVRHQPAPVRQRYAYYTPAMKWAEPDVAHAAELMRQVWLGAGEAAGRSTTHAEKLREQFSLEKVGRAARIRLSQLLQKTNPEKSGRLQAEERRTRLQPAIPIPAEWYDADYFEHGRKSNWTEGYHWPGFAGLFRDTAAFLEETFVEAQTFLDAGCAKGFLVRALRERGKEAWGFDHSQWAVEQAEEVARPFLFQARAESAEASRKYDITLAFSLLESLTEEQAREFLNRSRAWTKQALMIVALTCENELEQTKLAAGDHDLSHVTLRTSAWWQELAQQAGWKQDALHRLAQRACRKHPLPLRMGWRILIFSAS